MRDICSGVSEKLVKSTLHKSKLYQQINLKFGNKALIRPIRAKAVMDRLQIDLVSMNAYATEYRGTLYRYVLSLLDVFSRFVFLRPLETKSPKEIAPHLKEIFLQHGSPKILQSDCGKEFFGEVKKLMRTTGVKIVKSRPYHPQSQGKVERCHRPHFSSKVAT